ncbi:hypothetical protein NBCG_01083 [Nocardioidaceae bacterium Broad-1]|nr:hypothetical protein NBCG_01083 [Nocardioidaceae bacterium Broad-1]
MTWQGFESITSKSERVPLKGSEYLVPKVFGCRLYDFDDGAPEVEILWSVVDGVPLCREVRVTAVDTDHEIKRSGVAGVGLDDLLDKTMKALVWNADARRIDDPQGRDFPDGSSQRSAIRAAHQARASRKVKITDELLREVAEIYRANVEHEPTQAVADHFDKAHRTAALYIKRAREAGYLGAALKGKAGEQ